MGRITRISIPGIPHHVTQRGVRGIRIFDTDSDRESFLRKLRSKSEKFGLKILCWCLMPNHYHLIAVPEDQNSMTLSIGRANWAYAKDYNERTGESGRLFQGRFYSTPMDVAHCAEAIKYVLLNPVRACMVRHSWDYRWSSARYLTGMISKDPLVQSRSILDISDWKTILTEGSHNWDHIRNCTITGIPCGNKNFMDATSKITGLNFSPKKRGRPPNYS